MPPDDVDPSAALILASRVDIRESNDADTAVCTDSLTSCWSATTGEADEVDGADADGGVGAVVGVPALDVGAEPDVEAIQDEKRMTGEERNESFQQLKAAKH